MFPVCISYTTCISTHYNHVNLWIFILTHATQGSTITMICPDKVTRSLLFQKPFHILKLPPACSATSRHFYLPIHYEDHVVTIHLSLERTNLNKVNISMPDSHIWHHLDNNWTTSHMQKLVDIPKVPVAPLYKYMIGRVNLSYHLRSIQIWKNDPLLHVSS